MAYNIQILEPAIKEFKKLDKPVKEQIQKYIDKLAELEDPRSRGKALKGNFSNCWSYRVGCYRIIANINDENITIVILRISHRREVYK